MSNNGIAVNIQGKNFFLPTSIEEISLGRFLEFRKINPANNLQLMQWVLNSKHNFTDTDTIADEIAKCLTIAEPAIKEMYDFIQSGKNHDIPTEVNVLGEVIKFKASFINEMPYWPYEVVKMLIQKEIEKGDKGDQTELIPQVLSHYFYSIISKSPYDEDKASEFVDIINDIPMVEAIQAANFFFRKCQSSSPGKLKSFLRILNPNTKKRG